jgi:two-component system chemotaxis sensor kinase CheA
MRYEEWTVFAEEASTAIHTIEESLLNLESMPATMEDLHCLYRGLHTLKGSSGFLSLRSFGRVAHACEELVGLARDHDVPLDDEMVALLLEALDKLRWAVDFLAREQRDVPPEDVDDLVERLMVCFQARGGTTVERDAGPSEPVLFDDEPDAPLEETETTEAFIASFVATVPPAAAASADAAPAAPANTSPAKQGARPEARMEFLRIDGAKVSSLMDMAAELGLACSAVTNHPEVAARDFEGFATAAHKLELLVRAIQNDLSALRLVPVAPLFQRMRRVVRDAAKTTNKEVELVILGDDTEVDKVMLDAIQDPLVHVLRNAVDHGLEQTADRVAANKPAQGRIILSATQQGGEVTIEVRDDGRGIDRGRVLARAKERGLCRADAEPSDAEIANFVFLPGFSTKEKADELSGRGVGMDVLKTTVEGLRGRVNLTSKPGSGSRVSMTMPLTLAFVEAMVVRENGRLFALPIEKVFEVSVVDGARVVTNPSDNQMMLRVRDSCVPVVWLHRFWGESRIVGSELDGRLVVIVQTTSGAVALPVDELIGNQQVMLKPLRGALASIRAAASCGMLGTGDVAIALDCDRLHA